MGYHPSLGRAKRKLTELAGQTICTPTRRRDISDGDQRLQDSMNAGLGEPAGHCQLGQGDCAIAVCQDFHDGKGFDQDGRFHHFESIVS